MWAHSLVTDGGSPRLPLLLALVLARTFLWLLAVGPKMVADSDIQLTQPAFMSPEIIAAFIGLGGTVVAAFLGQSGALDALFHGRKYPRLPKELDSTWVMLNDTEKRKHRERFYITGQRGPKVRGYILYDDAPGKRWEFEGHFTGRFLQLFYYPSEQADDKLFQDYGCYFFELRGAEFSGYSVGYEFDTAAIGVAEHHLVPKK